MAKPGLILEHAAVPFNDASGNRQAEASAGFLGAESRLETGVLKPETRGVRWKKITLIGVGLLGGSLGMAVKKRRLASSVVGFVRRAASVEECKGRGAVN